MAPATSFYWFRNRYKEYVPFSQKSDIVFCRDIPVFNIEYKLDDWRLYINSSKGSLKTALLHNSNKYAFLLIEHSVHLMDDTWTICDDLKVVPMILVSSSYTIFPCLLCEWDSRTRE